MDQCIKIEEIQIEDIKIQPSEENFIEFIHDLPPLKLDEIQEKNLDTEFKCVICGKEFFDNLLLLIHDMFHDTNNYCFICKKKIAHNFYDHISSSHFNLICPICKKVFAWKNGLEAHMTFHSVSQASCDKYFREDILKTSNTSNQAEITSERKIRPFASDCCSHEDTCYLRRLSDTFSYSNYVQSNDTCTKLTSNAATNLSSEQASVLQVETPFHPSSSPLQEPVFPSPNKSIYDSRIELNGYTSNNKRQRKRKDFCFYCRALVLNFARHIHRNHSTERAVQKIFMLPAGSGERKKELGILRKKGNYVLSIENPRAVKRSPIGTSILPCSNCLGFYSAKQLWRHSKKCIGPHSKIKKVDAQNFLVKNLKVDPQLKSEVFPRMRADDISLIAKKDFLICAYATRYIQIHRNKHVASIASRKMRELAKVLIEVRKKKPEIKNLFQLLDPKYFKLLVQAVNVLAKYNKEKNIYEVPSCAISIGANLKQCCEIAVVFVSEDKDEFIEDSDVKIKANLNTVVDLIKSHWRSIISNLETDNLNFVKYNKGAGFKTRCQNVNYTDSVSCIPTNLVKNNCEHLYNTPLEHDNNNILNHKICNKNTEFREQYQNEHFASLNNDQLENGNDEINDNNDDQEMSASNTSQHLEDIDLQNHLFREVNLSPTHISNDMCQSETEEVDIKSTNQNKEFTREYKCYICGMSVLNFLKHVQRNHPNEFTVGDILTLPPERAERKGMLDILKGKSIRSCKDSLSEDKVLGQRAKKICDIKDAHYGILLTHKKRRILTPWTAAQKAVINNFFAKHIDNKKPPKKHECMKVKGQHFELLKNKDWLKIKVYVQNQYVKQSNKK